MKKIKKIFLGISALWSTMIAKVYATLEAVNIVYAAQGLYGPPPMAPIEKAKMPLITIIAIIIGLNVILRKKFKKKKNVLNIVLIMSSVVVTVLIIFLIALLFV